MTLVSLADAAQQLGIDAKTLRHWLAQAQLPLRPWPQDARKKGLPQEHLHLLADRHQRALPLGPPTPGEALAPAQACERPADLLARLDALQSQVAALQQQVQTLAERLAALPAPIAAPPVQMPPSQAAPARRAPHVLPRVEVRRDGQYVVLCPKQGLLPFAPESPDWFVWLATQPSFRFVGRQGRFTAHHEIVRVPNGAWRAHRHFHQRSYTLRLAPSQGLTIAVLEQAAATLQTLLV